MRYIGEMKSKIERHVLAILRQILGSDGRSMGQKELAELAGCSLATIQSVELGRLKLSQRLAEKIATVCGVSPDWLLQDDPSAPPTAWLRNGEFTAEVFKATQAASTKFDPGGQAISRWNMGFHLADLFACYVTAEKRGVSSAFLFRNRLARLITSLEADYPLDLHTMEDQGLPVRLQKAIGGSYATTPTPASPPAESPKTSPPRPASPVRGNASKASSSPRARAARKSRPRS